MKYTYNEVPGWFDFQDVYNLAVDNSKDGDKLVELGAFLGKSTCYMMEQIKKSNKKLDFYTVDLFKITPDDGDGSMPWGENARQWEKRNGGENALYEAFLTFTNNSVASEFLKGHFRQYSNLAADNFQDNEVNFVFIDASHLYENVKKDLESWYPKIKKGGIIAGHDYGDRNPDNGVYKAVNEFAGKYGLKVNSNYSFWMEKKN